MKMKVSLICQILTDSILICADANRFNDGIAGQLLAYRTELEVFYPNQSVEISLSETIVNLVAKAMEVK